MEAALQGFNSILGVINGILWSDITLYTILLTGLLFTVWSKFSPVLALTHGIRVLFGHFDKKDDPGAINHFQALAAALSATVGLGNIGGVAIAVALGGPGAVFWMWVVGTIGMSLKTFEVSASMLYRNTDDPENPHGGPMWVARLGFAEMGPTMAAVGKGLAVIFCCTVLISAVTGGNMFQSWNVADLSYTYFGLEKWITGTILAVITGAVIIGGIKRIGNVAGALVPFMCGLYLIAGLIVLAMNITEIPGLIGLIFKSAFSPTEAGGAFLGGTMGYAFLWGMKRALFSNEAGQGSAPMAHAAAKTDEPIREGILAGLGPFIDTLVVCTITALVILSTGAWNRGPAADLSQMPEVSKQADGSWTLSETPVTSRDSKPLVDGQEVFLLVEGEFNDGTGNNLVEWIGKVKNAADGSGQVVGDWSPSYASAAPAIINTEVYAQYRAASLTAHAFDREVDGLGKWLVTLASWLFAISTIISWSYYGEQGIVYLFGDKAVLPYKISYCLLCIVASLPLVTTTTELGNLTDLGTGVMLFANIPICLIMSRKVMAAYHDYVRRLKAGEFHEVK